MTRAPYAWRVDSPPPKIKQHSVAKHEILHSYLVDYIRTLVVSPHQDEMRLTLVDGFAGGGIYVHEDSRAPVLGSPFVFLNAAKEAELIINQGRMKPLRMNLDYFFIEVDASAYELLEETLKKEGHGHRIGVDIQLRNSRFEIEAGGIKAFIKKKSPRGGRSIFLLDQYGYKDVPAPLIRSILMELPGAEVILTFNVDAFINFASNSGVTNNLLEQIGVPDVFKGRTIEDIKVNERDFRLFIQSCLYRGLVEACGAPYYTLFFIRTGGHGDYWLVHLSQHPRARDVMTRIHWAKNNYFIHYGGAGIEMFHALGYTPKRDGVITGQSDLGFCFDEPARDASIQMLMNQLPRLIFARPEGLSFGELFATTCNMSPADSATYKEALIRLVRQNEIEIVTVDGGSHRSASTISDRDQIVASKQQSFGF